MIRAKFHCGSALRNDSIRVGADATCFFNLQNLVKKASPR
jgi:hypothetical protein